MLNLGDTAFCDVTEKQLLLQYNVLWKTGAQYIVKKMVDLKPEDYSEINYYQENNIMRALVTLT